MQIRKGACALYAAEGILKKTTKECCGQAADFICPGHLPNNLMVDKLLAGNSNIRNSYRHAMWHSIELLKELPLCQRIIKEAHRILMTGVRGHGKSPGEYRKIPNWIGPAGCSIEEAKFVPISADQLQRGVDTWERYVHEDAPDRLVQLALLHAEFEAIHPFLDGNECESHNGFVACENE
jgi:hypothetical protein